MTEGWVRQPGSEPYAEQEFQPFVRQQDGAAEFKAVQQGFQRALAAREPAVNAFFVSLPAVLLTCVCSLGFLTWDFRHDGIELPETEFAQADQATSWIAMVLPRSATLGRALSRATLRLRGAVRIALFFFGTLFFFVTRIFLVTRFFVAMSTSPQHAVITTRNPGLHPALPLPPMGWMRSASHAPPERSTAAV